MNTCVPIVGRRRENQRRWDVHHQGDVRESRGTNPIAGGRTGCLESEGDMPISRVPKQTKDDTGIDRGIEFELTDPVCSFDDVILPQRVRDQIEDALALFRYKDLIYGKWRLAEVMKKPAGICMNLYGVSGTGKTMTANAIADELGMKILRVDYARIESKYVGETSKNISNLFKVATESGALLLFDEADALLSKRVTDMSSATDVSVNQTRTVLLMELDRYSGIAVFTTNFIENYDHAFMRRIPYHIHFDYPSLDARVAILDHYLQNTIPNRINRERVAGQYPLMTGSDAANATLLAALNLARKGGRCLSEEDFTESLERTLANRKQKSVAVNVTVEQRDVSEDYALSQINEGVSRSILG